MAKQVLETATFQVLCDKQLVRIFGQRTLGEVKQNELSNEIRAMEATLDDMKRALKHSSSRIDTRESIHLWNAASVGTSYVPTARSRLIAPPKAQKFLHKYHPKPRPEKQSGALVGIGSETRPLRSRKHP